MSPGRKRQEKARRKRRMVDSPEYKRRVRLREKARHKRRYASCRFYRARDRLLKYRVGAPGTPLASCAELRQLWESQGGRCALTGIPLLLEEAELDHSIPRSKGGGHTIGNLRWVHKMANRAKGEHSDAEFQAWLDKVVRARYPDLTDLP